MSALLVPLKNQGPGGVDKTLRTKSLARTPQTITWDELERKRDKNSPMEIPREGHDRGDIL